MKMTRANLILAFSVLLLLCSCEGKLEDSKHPLFIKGQKFVESQDYDSALKAFKEYLQINPNSAKAHYELALLYDDQVNDSLMSIYHYRSYLELVPDSQDKENAKMWLEQAEKKYFEKNWQRFSAEPEAKKELEALKIKEASYINSIEKLLKENKYLKMQSTPETQMTKADGEANVKSPAETAANPLAPEPITPKNSPPLSSSPQSGKTYKIQQGDTLSKISRKVYGDSKYFNLIFEANKDKLKSPSDLKLGEDITIPAIPQKKTGISP